MAMNVGAVPMATGATVTTRLEALSVVFFLGLASTRRSARPSSSACRGRPSRPFALRLIKPWPMRGQSSDTARSRGPACSSVSQRSRESSKHLDPESFHVFKTLERRLEEAQRDLVMLEAIDDAGRARTARADAAMLAQAEQLDVLEIWNAPTTTNRDRKELIRMLVRSIVVENPGPECLRLRIRWTDGNPDRTIDVRLQAGSSA